ncbi:MAG: SufD family Fe-S cluster assembly protein [bacterium]|nr:SufD family Fe-S cluster assembly protein [bacterium]
MRKEIQMTVNRLPVRTWNHLGMNESQVLGEEGAKPFSSEARLEGENVFWTLHAAALPVNREAWKQNWTNIASGMGADMNAFGKADGSDIAMLYTEAEKDKEGQEETKIQKAELSFAYEDGGCYANRLYLHAAEETQLDVTIVLKSGERSNKGFASLQIKAYAERNAQIRIRTVQLLGKGFCCLNDFGGVCEENAKIELLRLELGAGTLYAGGEATLQGQNSSFEAEIAYRAEAGQRLDMNYVARHYGKKSQSQMNVSGVMEENSFKLFRGTIDFVRGCGGSKGEEKEEVLLLGEELVNQTIPLILCGEEDVEGNHGASMGRLDEAVLFYLSSRGIPEKEAEEMIARARIDAVCAKIPQEEVRELVQDFLDREDGRKGDRNADERL